MTQTHSTLQHCARCPSFYIQQHCKAMDLFRDKNHASNLKKCLNCSKRKEEGERGAISYPYRNMEENIALKPSLIIALSL